MQEIFNFLVSLFTGFFTFLDDFKIVGDLSFLHLIFILMIFNFLLKFLYDDRGE